MPLLPFTHEDITVDVRDRVYAGTTIKQKAKFERMNIVYSPRDGSVEVRLFVKVALFANNADGSYGDKLNGRGLSDYDVMLVADNNAAVNATTGEVLYLRTNESDEAWLALVESKPENLMLQGNFFEYLMNHQPVEIAPMIRNFMLQADGEPYLKYS